MPLPTDLSELGVFNTVPNSASLVGGGGLWRSGNNSYAISRTDLKGDPVVPPALGDWVQVSRVDGPDYQFQRIYSVYANVTFLADTDPDYFTISLGLQADSGLNIFDSVATYQNFGPNGRYIPSDLAPYLLSNNLTINGAFVAAGSSLDPPEANAFTLGFTDTSAMVRQPWFSPDDPGVPGIASTVKIIDVTKTAPYVTEYVASDATFETSTSNNSATILRGTWLPENPPKYPVEDRADHLYFIQIANPVPTESYFADFGATNAYEMVQIEEDGDGRLWAFSSTDAPNYSYSFLYSDDDGVTWTLEPSLEVNSQNDLGFAEQQEVGFTIDKASGTAVVTGTTGSKILYCPKIEPGAVFTSMGNFIISSAVKFQDPCLIPNGTNFVLAAARHDSNNTQKFMAFDVDTSQTPWVATVSVADHSIETQPTRGGKLTWNHDGNGYLRSEQGGAPAWSAAGVTYLDDDLVQHLGVEWRCLTGEDASPSDAGNAPSLDHAWEPSAGPNLYIYYEDHGPTLPRTTEYRLPWIPDTAGYDEAWFSKNDYDAWPATSTVTGSMDDLFNIADDADYTYMSGIYEGQVGPDLDADTFYVLRKKKGTGSDRNGPQWELFIGPPTGLNGTLDNSIPLSLDVANNRLFCAPTLDSFNGLGTTCGERAGTWLDIATGTFSNLFEFAKFGDIRGDALNGRGEMLRRFTAGGSTVLFSYNNFQGQTASNFTVSLSTASGLQNVYAGAVQVDAFYAGGQQVDAVYAGTELVYG